MQVNTQRAFGLHGGLFNISALQIHGNNLSANNLQTLQTASGIESDRATRLWELWCDQKFLEEDRLDIKVGQQSLAQEFMVTTNTLYFVNTMFGWPMLPSTNLLGGGPAYPLSAFGGRISVRPIDGITVLAGVFNGSPVSNNNGDSQLQNRYGTSFPLDNGTLSIMEVQFSYPAVSIWWMQENPRLLDRPIVLVPGVTASLLQTSNWIKMACLWRTIIARPPVSWRLCRVCGSGSFSLARSV
ncbi:MAG: carbohydrate porin [Glaciimonas sp.]|nr:carbohydrate porin [Glaciimonas sp.]